MARNVAKPGGLDSDRRVSVALSLLGALDASPDARIDADAFARGLSLSDTQLDEIIELLQLVSDENTGARVAIRREENLIALDGNAGRFGVVRFTSDEVLAIMQVLDRFHIDENVRRRVQIALAPTVQQADQDLLAGDPLFGGFYQDLCEAMVIGARMKIEYQPIGEERASERIIDPGFITVSGDAAYLIAWNIAKDEQRWYRLDRISHVSITEDSVVNHPFERESVEESLKAAGETVEIGFWSSEFFDRCDWSGLDRLTAWVDEGSTIHAMVSYVSKPWLFDQVLAAGGLLEILGPETLRKEFVDYARNI